MFKNYHLFFTLGLFVAMVAFFGLWRYEVLDHSKTKSDLTLANGIIVKHEDNIKTSEEVANDLQISLNNVRSELRSVLNQPVQCHPTRSGAGTGDAATPGQKLPEGNALRSDFLLDFGGRAEETAVRLLGCQEFIRKSFKLNE